MPCDRCLRDVTDATAHGVGVCPFEARASESTVRADDIPGGMVIENMTAQPLTFYSHSAHRAYMKAHGLRFRDDHVTGDRHLPAWGQMDRQTLANAEALAARQ